MLSDDKPKNLDHLHHIAVQVDNLDETVDWYCQKFSCELVYKDDTWAMLRFENIYLAFVMPGQHPPHIAFARKDAENYGELKPHRDGTRSVYITDPAGMPLKFLLRIR